MVTNISYNVIIDRLKAFATGHYLIKHFSHGQIDLRYLEQGADYYPWMHVIPGTINPAEGLREYSFDITFSDLTRDKEHESEYIREAISDCTRLAEDLLAEIKNGNTLFDSSVQIVDGSSITPFIHEDTHTLTGVTLSLSIRVPWDWSACDIPADYAPGGSSSGGGAFGGCCVTLQVGGIDNIDQSLLNLIAGTNMTITDNGDGSVTFDSTGGGGGGLLLALPFTTDHISETGNEYLIGDVVYYSGNVYRCIANNDSILPTDANYWLNLGAGYPLIQQPSDWDSTSGNNQILNKPTLATVATTGDYNDLLNLPVIPDVSGFVPYTGATQDVDLDANKLSAESIYIEGTNGKGHLHLKHQNADATATGQSTSLWADSNGDIKWKNDGDYKTTLKSSLNTADRVYTLPNETCELLPRNTAILGDTKTKIKYDSDGLVIEGFDIVASDVSDSTTVGRNLLTLANPSAITYLKVAANNTVSAITAAQLKTDLGIPSGTMFRLIKTADQSITASNTTAVDITDLTFPITSGKKYRIRAFLIHSGNPSAGLKFGVNANVAVTSVYQYNVFVTGTTNNAISILSGNTLGVLPFTAGVSASLLMSNIECIIDANNTGTAAIQFAKSVATGGTLTIKAGSIVEYYEY